MLRRFDIVVVGAGHAGVAIVGRLRQAGFAGSLALVGDEACAPYQRPPLTKGFLGGGMAVKELALADDLAAVGVEHLAGVRVELIDRDRKQLRLSDGSAIGFGKLALATGSRPRRLVVPGAEAAAPFYLTTMDDCLALQARLPAVAGVTIIGGGFIGLEAAATLRGLGRSVALIEMQDRLLARSASPILSAYLEVLHRREGVDIRTGTGIEAIGAAGVRCTDGSEVAADAIIVGIGSLPNDDLARAAGLRCDDGIVVDRHGVTSDPDIVAAGDCTRHPNDFAPTGTCRLESVQNAVDQAEAAAATLLGTPTRYRSVPTFWSDQFDARIGIVGIGQGAEELAIRGEIESGSFSVYAFRDGRLVAVESINRPKDQRLARKIILSRNITPAQVRDPSIDLAAVPA
ncbi:NAD(P)/FAD-dependent oxidoreductase [Sphingoaurantiacus capsulatus]|uniref:NAD(P)/FAD-dependent oxidoreductase n=1 Tax=Sphingoaurantiacus capsulatus TaxID=1771310 RepID=A0ABV7XAQ2_9SPHN